MPVFFFIDPDFVNDPTMTKIDTITLSYTFFSTSIGIFKFSCIGDWDSHFPAEARYDKNGTLTPMPMSKKPLKSWTTDWKADSNVLVG